MPTLLPYQPTRRRSVHGQFADGQFADSAFRRQDSSPTELFADKTVRRQYKREHEKM